MVVEFKITNFRSYKDEAIFSFLALDSDYNSNSVSTVYLENGQQLRLLNTAAIFGANASGKSNIIHALNALSSTVRESLSYTSKSTPHLFQPYALTGPNLDRTSDFSFDFVVNQKRYSYLVKASKEAIKSEQLLIFKNDASPKIIFKRENDENNKVNIELGSEWPIEKSIIDDSNLLPNQLLLSWLATKDAAGLQDVADYIAYLPVIIDDEKKDYRQARQDVMENIIGDTSSIVFRRLQNLMRIADVGVHDIMASRHGDNDFKLPGLSDIEKESIINSNRWEIRLSHDTESAKIKCALPFNMESLGTKALFITGARILKTLETGGFVAFDEINAAIHPALLRLLVNLFQSPVSNPHGAQLLFTTHDASVADYDTLRSDQVWFVEKKNGSSDLFSAQDFEDVDIRVPFEMWYRSGRFGALPVFGNVESIFDL